MTSDATLYEAEAAVTRDRIAATIDGLQERLSPKALVDGALDSLSAARSRAAASMRDAAIRHPVVLGAVGLAVGMGVLASSRVARAKVEYGDAYAAYADYDDSYAANLADGEPPAGKARAQLDAIQHEASATVGDNPLAVLAIGLAAGALVGAIVRVSSVEADLFGEARGRLIAAGDAAMASAGREFDARHLSLAGGTAGITERLTASVVSVLLAAGAALIRPVTPGSPD